MIALAFASGCFDLSPDDEKACSFWHRFEVSVENIEGERVLLSDVELIEDGRRVDCSLVSRSLADCTVRRPGSVVVRAFADGLEFAREVEITEGPSCSLQGGPLVLVDGRPVCVPSRLTAIEAELFWSEDVPVGDHEKAAVVVTLDRYDIICTRQGNKFSCPPEAGAHGRASGPFFDDRRVYEVRAILGSSTLTQHVPIAVDACQVDEPARIRFVHSAVPCTGARMPALSVSVVEATTFADANKRYNFLPADAVSIIDADGSASPCPLEPPQAGALSGSFKCSAATPAGGVYTVEIRHQGGIERVLVLLRDDGCAPVRSSLALTFFPGQFCDNDTRCGPYGETLRSFSLCPNLPKEDLPAICQP